MAQYILKYADESLEEAIKAHEGDFFKSVEAATEVAQMNSFKGNTPYEIVRHVDKQLMDAAPALLDFVRRIVTEQADMGDHGDAVIISEGESLIQRAGG